MGGLSELCGVVDLVQAPSSNQVMIKSALDGRIGAHCLTSAQADLYLRLGAPIQSLVLAVRELPPTGTSGRVDELLADVIALDPEQPAIGFFDGSWWIAPAP